MLKNSKEKFGNIAIGLHWLIALAVIALLAVGLYMSDMEASPDKIKLYGLHKSFGITVLFMMALRLAWRLANIQPDFVITMKPIEKTIAKLAYFAFYALLFAMPLSGWAMSSAGGRPVRVFDFFTLPDLVSQNKELREFFGEFHEIAAWGLIGLIALHVLAALKHHFISKDGTLRKMLPIFALCLLTSLPAQAQAPTWTVLADQSQIGFSGKQMGSAFTGSFNTYTAIIAFDPEHLDQSSVNVSIDIGSADTQDGERDKALRESDWFDVIKFPKASFVSSAFRKLPDGHYEVTGSLSIRNKTLPISFPFTLTVSQKPDGKESAVMDASLVLKRLDFDLGLEEWKDISIIENEVPLSLHIVAERSVGP